MVRQAQNHVLYEGDEPTLRFYLYEEDEEGNVLGPLDLTGATLTYRLGTVPIQQVAMVIFGTATDGVADVLFDSSYTSGFGGAPGDYERYFHEVLFIPPSGAQQVVAVGTLVVRGALHDEVIA